MNAVTDVLGLFAEVLAQMLGGGSNADPAGNAANLAAIVAARVAASLAPAASGTVLTSNGTSAAPTFKPGGITNPMTTLGDVLYGGASGTATRLAGDTSGTRKFLREVSSGGVAAAPVWDTLQAGDIPDLAYVDTVTAADSSVQVTGSADTPAVASVAAQLAQRTFCV